MKAEPRFWPAVGGDVWDRIRAEFTLPALHEVRTRFDAAHADPGPLLHQLVRIFIGDGTYCPGFQFTDEGTGLDPTVIALHGRALELQVPHNVFAGWMVAPLTAAGPRPVDVLAHRDRLLQSLEAFARNRP